MLQIAPSIICADFSRLGEDIEALEAAGADLFHFDVMDGQFVPNITLGALVIEAVRPSSELLYETHLMVLEPDELIERFVLSGSQRMIVHVEACRHLLRTLNLIRSFDSCQTGMAINPGTPAVAAEPALDYLDLLTVMTVNPGFAGQAFLTPMLRKIEQLRRMVDARGLRCLIEVDGGLSPENIRSIADAGADLVVGGNSSVFLANQPYDETIAALRRALT